MFSKEKDMKGDRDKLSWRQLPHKSKGKQSEATGLIEILTILNDEEGAKLEKRKIEDGKLKRL